jgi:dihydroorotate dehydrogenase (NAD+) catalytic subunit
LIDFSAFGAIITKTLPPEPRKGNYGIDPFNFWENPFWWHCCHILSRERKRVLRKIPGGWLNNMAWWSCGIDHWIEKIYPRLQGVTVIPNIGGFIIDHYTESIHKLNPLKVAGIELDIHCPNVTNPLSENPSELVKLFAFCRATSRHPLIVKVGANGDYLRVARIAQYCGLNAISAINAVPVLGGAYSGKGIKYIALKVVSDIKKETGLPVIGGGGIASWKDCQDFFAAGADAVTLGSGFLSFFRFWRPTWIAKKYGKEKDSK